MTVSRLSTAEFSDRGRFALPLALWLVLQIPASAADITVNGGCTLASAITAANSDSSTTGCSAGSGADRIILTGDVTLTTAHSGSNGLPSVTTDITIVGNGHTIARGASAPAFRIFHVAGTLTLENTTVSNGGGPSFDSDWGGGIYSYGTLNLDHSIVYGSSAHKGGGLANSGGTVNLTNSEVTGNTASNKGGGIFHEGGSLMLLNSTLSGNTVTDGYGGGLYFGSGSVGLTSSTISGNSAPDGLSGFGGGIYARGAAISVTNSTLSGNSAGATFAGSALELGFGASATLTNVTVAGNTGGVAAIYAYDGPAELANDIVAHNSPANCKEVFGQGSLIDSGNNVVDDLSCGTSSALTSGIDPTLAENGGPTMTHALLPGSNAIDFAGDCGLDFDQRGVARSDEACDSGSVELASCTVLELKDDTCIDTQSEQACEIHVGPNYAVTGPSGNLTLTAGSRVVLLNGVTVQSDGVLTIGLDPNL